MKTASYARQSIEKQDSVSIDAQFEKCELICRLNNWETTRYSDVGYSGSNIKRPAFEQLIKDIKVGKVNRVISYRLDRISRSISDFANLLQLFENYNVQYISATENFDTSTPIGRAMIYIVMVFAQLERETITQRITDNYYFRAKQGLFMGGNSPLGYRPIRIEKNGKKASVLEVDPNTSELINRIFELFVMENFNPNRIALYLNEKDIKTQKSRTWSRNKVLRILQNPAYCPNTPDIYGYLLHSGYSLAQPPEEYDGTKGLCIYGKEKDCKTVVIGDFSPLVSSKIWLTAQYRLSYKKAPSRLGTSETSWLSGLISCSLCGHSMTIKSSVKRGKKYSYFHCSGHSGRGPSACSNKTYYGLSELESFTEEALLNKVESLNFSDFHLPAQFSPKSELIIGKNSLLARIYTIENEINSFIQQIGKGTAVIDKYLNQKITDLDNEKASLLKEAEEIDNKLCNDFRSIYVDKYQKVKEDFHSTFRNSDLQNKKLLSSALIKGISLDDSSNIELIWFM